MVPYLLCAFTIAMMGFAAWSLVKSPEERWNRESFLYNYGAFFAYAILAFIGILAYVEYYRTNAILKAGVAAALSGPVAAMGLGPLYSAFAWGVPQQAIQTLEKQQQQQQQQEDAMRRKPRRQIGYGRYHT